MLAPSIYLVDARDVNLVSSNCHSLWPVSTNGEVRRGRLRTGRGAEIRSQNSEDRTRMGAKTAASGSRNRGKLRPGVTAIQCCRGETCAQDIVRVAPIRSLLA